MKVKRTVTPLRAETSPLAVSLPRNSWPAQSWSPMLTTDTKPSHHAETVKLNGQPNRQTSLCPNSERVSRNEPSAARERKSP